MEKQCGGESVSQSPLKVQAFSAFLEQNPPFELPPENGIPMAHHPQHCHQAAGVVKEL
jgi:hypothetical protein